MVLEVLALAEAMVDIYHEPISEEQLRAMGMEPGGWYEFDPTEEVSIDRLAQIMRIPVRRKLAGSSPGNMLTSLRKLNGSTLGFVSAVSDDDNGNLYQNHISEHGFDDHAQRMPGATNPYLHVLFTPDGERTFLAYTGCTPNIDLNRDVPDARVGFTAGYEIAKIGDGTVDFLARYSRQCELLGLDVASAALAKQERARFQAAVAHINILFTSPAEYEGLTGKAFDETDPFTDFSHLGIIVLKLGSDGSKVFTQQGATHYVPANNVPTSRQVNKNGLGDGYIAGFFHALENGYSVERAAQMGTAVAAQIYQQEEPHLTRRFRF